MCLYPHHVIEKPKCLRVAWNDVGVFVVGIVDCSEKLNKSEYKQSPVHYVRMNKKINCFFKLFAFSRFYRMPTMFFVCVCFFFFYSYIFWCWIDFTLKCIYIWERIFAVWLRWKWASSLKFQLFKWSDIIEILIKIQGSNNIGFFYIFDVILHRNRGWDRLNMFYVYRKISYILIELKFNFAFNFLAFM